MHLVEKLRDLLHLIDDYLMDRAGRGELFSKPFLSGGDACDTEPQSEPCMVSGTARTVSWGAPPAVLACTRKGVSTAVEVPELHHRKDQ